MRQPLKKASWAGVAGAGPIRLAVDTEFEGAETLTVQFAARVRGEVRVQLYHAPGVPPPPRACFGAAFRDRFRDRVVVLPPKALTADLSPARVLADVFRLPPAAYLGRYEGDARRPPAANDGGASPALEPGRIEVVLTGHFLAADLLRAFGRQFLIDLLAPGDRPPAVGLRDGRVVGFEGTGAGDVFSTPVVEYVGAAGRLVEVRLGKLDTNRVCGPARLDDLAGSYLGISKDETVTGAEKRAMGRVFRDPSRAADAYRYAAQDAVLTLLVAERMAAQHAELYAGFDIPSEAVPPMHGTPGLRVANLVLQHVRRTVAAGSGTLRSNKRDGVAGLDKVKTLFGRGSAAALSDGRVSRYGKQTGDTHGGLLHSRTPFTFFHQAPGQFRDVDLQHCYPAIIRSMVVYAGRPLVLEPGRTAWSLRRAVDYLDLHADGPHAWYVKVSGPVRGFPNTLVPSTLDALTNDNYKDRAASRTARKASVAALDRKAAAWTRGERVDDRKYAALFTDEVRAGVVTRATWLMIQALPPSARAAFENLRAETVVFYPRKLVAGSGEEYDDLAARYRTGHPVDWAQELDLDAMTRTTVEDVDEAYVSLRYPVGELAGRLVGMREAAGKDTAAGRLYKTLANTLYGAFASPFLPTSNPVAANVVTGTARALAYAMEQSLNALQTNTDGVLYRRDRVPAGTFADRLAASEDYPLLHAGTGPFVAAAAIPGRDDEFSAWYVGHALRFFGVEGQAEYETLFGIHTLAHKPLPGGGTAFDGLFTDGGSNYGKLVAANRGGWRVADMKARSFGKEGKDALKDVLCRVYGEDRFVEPPPPVAAGRLLGVRDALAQARRAVGAAGEASRVVVPLGFMRPSLATYKLIKPSAFVFRTARQRGGVLADWGRLVRKTECGPELLAPRKAFGGSLSKVAEAIYRLVGRGQTRLNALNVDRLYRPGQPGFVNGNAVRGGRAERRAGFVESLRIGPGVDAASPTGLVVDSRSLAAVEAASEEVS